MKIRGSGSGFMSAGLAVLTVIMACIGPAPVEMDPDRAPEQTVEGLTLVQSREGQRSWRLISDTAVYTEGDSIALLSSVYLTFFTEDIPTTVLEGDSGRVDLQTGLMRIWGNVNARTDDDRRLETADITWDNEFEVLHSDCLVILSIPNENALDHTILKGRGVRLDTDLGGAEGVDIEEDFTAIHSGEVIPD